jgi:hypothetical protein
LIHKGGAGLPKLDSKKDEEVEQVDMKRLESDLRMDPQGGSRTYQSSIVKMMKRKRW